MTTSEKMLARYKMAEKFLPENGWDLLSKTGTSYHWNKDETKMIYKHDLYDEEKEYTFVDIDKGEQKVVFDHKIILKEINKYLDKKVTVLDLDISELTEDDNIIATIKGERFQVGIDNKVEKLENFSLEESPEAGTSPDGKWLIFVKEENLYLRNLETEEETQLTFDGEKGNGYGRELPNLRDMIDQQTNEPKQDLEIAWSPDSNYVFTYRLDYRGSTVLPVIQSSPPDNAKPKLFNPVYPCAGDDNLPQVYIYLIEVKKKNCRQVDEDPMPVTYNGCSIYFVEWFDRASEKYYYPIISRGDLGFKIKELDLKTGKSKLLLEQKSDRRLLNDFKYLDKLNKLLIRCDNDGWPHLYLYDLSTGEFECQLTEGDYGVSEVKYVDEKNKAVYFSAYGKEDCNPYYELLYRVNFDGTGLELLTPEKQFHQISFSSGKKYFIDIQSTVTDPEKYFLRKTSNGEAVLKLKELDISKFTEIGWTPVEEFIAKARDGKTDIYCNIHRPSNFDPNKKYPVIESIYAGPFSYFVSKSFNGNSSLYPAYQGYYAQVFAELGFIVVMIDGLGTSCRGNKFQDYSYKKVQDSGVPDRIAAMKQMKDKYPYMDLNKVGVCGGSLGGYDTVNAMLIAPDFYKVGIATAGCHDFTLDKAGYHEQYIGYPLGDYYEKSSNATRVDKLEGKLFIAHGEIDDNVPVHNTMSLVKALIDANKDFDMMILPNVSHNVWNNYFLRKMWDYFVTHLLGEVPPKCYKIG